MSASKVAMLRCGHVISVLLSAIDGTSRAQMLPQLKVAALDTLTYLAYCLCIGGDGAARSQFFLWQFIPGICSRLVRVLADILKRATTTGGTSRVVAAVVATLSTMLQVIQVNYMHMFFSNYCWRPGCDFFYYTLFRYM